MKAIINYFFLLFFAFGFTACKKYLDAKPDQKLSTPSKLEDLQAILDSYSIMNVGADYINNQSDEYYLDYADWETMSPQPYKDSYIWRPEIYISSGEGTDDWILQYRTVFYANTVLDELKKIPYDSQKETWNTVKGQALFFRAYAFFQLAQLYATQFDMDSAPTDPGIVLRLTSDFNKLSVRSSVQQTYDQILTDLNEALDLFKSNDLLPDTRERKTRPNKISTLAMLSKVYLQMGRYLEASKSANACLSQYDKLIKFSDIPNTSNPFTPFNEEVIFYTSTSNPINIYDWIAKIDSSIYKTYTQNDLRKKLYFDDNGNGTYAWKGSYNGDRYNLFNGIATDEIYLIRAECSARLGDVSAALSDLNSLLLNRWAVGKFVPFTANDANDALRQIILERRKELFNRGVRWSDLKRLNKDARFATTIKRILNGEIHELPPNDLRYTFLIPRRVIELTGIPQNKR